VAVAFPVAVAWLANLLLFPVSPTRLLEREFVTGWHAVSAATEQLTTSQTSAGARLLRPLVKGGPIRLLKFLKLSLIESRVLHGKQAELKRVILSLDKITRLLFSYAKTRLKSSGALAIAARETAILSGLKKEAESFQQEFEAGFVPSCNAARPAMETAENIAPQLAGVKTRRCCRAASVLLDFVETLIGGSDRFCVDSGIHFSGLRRNRFLFRRLILFCW
jgi:hypothetical protein